MTTTVWLRITAVLTFIHAVLHTVGVTYPAFFGPAET